MHRTPTRVSRGTTATRKDGREEIEGVLVCKCNCHAPLHATVLCTQAHPCWQPLPCRGAEEQGKDGGDSPSCHGHRVARRLGVFRVLLFNLPGQAAAVQANRPAVK